MPPSSFRRWVRTSVWVDGGEAALAALGGPPPRWLTSPLPVAWSPPEGTAAASADAGSQAIVIDVGPAHDDTWALWRGITWHAVTPSAGAPPRVEGQLAALRGSQVGGARDGLWLVCVGVFLPPGGLLGAPAAWQLLDARARACADALVGSVVRMLAAPEAVREPVGPGPA